MAWTRGPMNTIAAITTADAIAHDLVHIFRKPSIKPILILINVKEIIPVVTIPIRRAKPILCFNCVFIVVIFSGRKM